jgi:hypothetical protein
MRKSSANLSPGGLASDDSWAGADARDLREDRTVGRSGSRDPALESHLGVAILAIPVR